MFESKFQKINEIGFNSQEKKLFLNLDDGDSEFIKFNDERCFLKLSENEYLILKDVIDNQQNNLRICGNEYFLGGRDYCFFLYDISSLVWYLGKLPSKFNRLKKIKPSDDELLHNRVHAEIAFFLDQNQKNPEFERENSKGKLPDLHFDNKDVEVKTIKSYFNNDRESFLKFSRSFRTQHEKALDKIDQNGIIIVGFWSKTMNNNLRAYFRGLHSTEIKLKENTTILILDGEKTLQDYFVHIPTKYAQECIREFAERGYRRISPYSYGDSIRREGFPCGKEFNPLTGKYTIRFG